MHSQQSIQRTELVELSMEVQELAQIRIKADEDETQDLRELRDSVEELAAITNRRIRADIEENRDHAQMRRLTNRICRLMEGLPVEEEQMAVA